MLTIADGLPAKCKLEASLRDCSRTDTASGGLDGCERLGGATHLIDDAGCDEFSGITMTELQESDLVRAVHEWLSYQSLCGRGVIFSEAYLAHPIAEFLAACHNGNIAAEYRHPVLKRDGTGRPWQVDFVLLSPTKGNVTDVFESKWVTNRNYDKQDIVDDLLRLETFTPSGINPARYFLVAGVRQHVKEHFEELKHVHDHKRRPFTKQFLSLKLEHPDTTVHPRVATGRFRDYYTRFQDSYCHNLPGAFSTTLVARRRTQYIAVYMWRVKSSPGRTLFSPSDEW
jgi:hypothetical protein